MASDLTEEQQFRALVLGLKKRNPSWQPKDIANKLLSHENPGSLSKAALRWKINRALRRKQVKDLPGRGAKTTVVTKNFKNQVKKMIRLKKEQSQRKVTLKLQGKNIKGKRTSVQKAIKQLGLKPFRRRKAQKLTDQNRSQRVIAAKALRRDFGTRKNHKWKWNKVINTDFSGIITFEPFQNSKNDVIYAESTDIIPSYLREAPKDKYPKGIMFWGAISNFGLIPKKGPINFTQWLEDQRQGRRGRMYMTGKLYSRFLREKAIPEVHKVVGDLDNVIWQDDQDSKHRSQAAMNTVNDFFQQRIKKDYDGKFGDVYPIENIWGIIHEKTRGKKFKNALSLVRAVNAQWRTITVEDCKHMMEKIPERLLKVIQNEGNQVYEH